MTGPGHHATEPAHSSRRVRLWWSTGKDSAWALYTLRKTPGVEVVGLVTTVTPHFGRVAIHGTRLELLDAQARRTGLPVERIELPWPCSNRDYEAAVAPALARARSDGVTGMAFGDLFLSDVRDYRERLLEGSGIEPLFPLWGRDTAELAHEMVAGGLEAVITALDPGRVDRSLAGERWDPERIAALSPGVDPCGENGEFHTCVIDAPVFDAPLGVERGVEVEREGVVYRDLALGEGGGAAE
ncbi:MAG: hypothetical protein RQ745_10415 [Longimicrobiales bacterium]|nr:hypothetical protein [Longimicrobiales bacterium]